MIPKHGGIRKPWQKRSDLRSAWKSLPHPERWRTPWVMEEAGAVVFRWFLQGSPPRARPMALFFVMKLFPVSFASYSRVFAILAISALTAAGAAEDPRWEVPVGGNTFLTQRGEGSQDGVNRRGGLGWQDPQSVFSVYFRVDRPAELDLSLLLKVPDGESTFKATIGGKEFEIKAAGAETHEVGIGRITAEEAGYLRLDLQGLMKTGATFADVSSVVISSETAGLSPAFVRSNEGNMFYWGRRGPSVHLGYDVPPGRNIEYAYSELTVPEGEDVIGSYFMANGFGEGYFGIQVKSPSERWILFSVWSPFQTDNPRDIPEDQRVIMLAKGEDVRVGEFGNEGSGGQSFVVFPWKAATTYRFLNTVKPDGMGNSIYAAWFGEVGKDGWKLIARFKRPKTDKHLTGFHSFLENFSDNNGHLGRRAIHSNQWVRDTDGAWHEITGARFTGDGTASGGHRLDFAGGLSDNGFFLCNGGFFAETVTLNQRFHREPNPDAKPEIDFPALD